MSLYQDFDRHFRETLLLLHTQQPQVAQKMAAYKYELAYTAAATLSQPCPVYMVGLKPFAAIGQEYPDPVPHPAGYHAYIDLAWQSPYPRRAIRLLEWAQRRFSAIDSVRDIPVSNWYFYRAEDSRQLRKYGLPLIDCSRHHARILASVQPRVVICVGNSKSLSAFAGMCKLHGSDISQAVLTPYRERTQLKYLTTDERLIVGLPHLSRYDVTEEMLTWLEDCISKYSPVSASTEA